MLCSISTKVDKGMLEAINALEKDLGHTVLAFSCHQAKPAELSRRELDKIKDLENRLGLSLVAVEN